VGFIKALRDKFGAFYRLLTYGDAFIRVGTNPSSKYPIKFQNTSLTNIYVDPYATAMRNEAGENDVDELVAIYKYSWDEAIELYPDLKKKGGVGLIPRGKWEDQIEYTQEQLVEQNNKREVEIVHYYNKSKKRYTVFAGTAMTVLSDLKDAEYPFVMNKEAYIPFIHLMCFPAAEGFYNHGIGHYVYRLAVITRQLDNKAINYGMDNVDPIRMVNVPKGEASKFFNKLFTAEETQSSGRKGFLVNEYGAGDQARQVNVDTFQSTPITQEWERLFTRLEQSLKRIGINIDEVDISSATATERIASDEHANQAVRQIMEQNASEFQFAWELGVDFVKEFISKNDKTVINMTTAVPTPEGGSVSVDNVTMGDLKQDLKDNHWFFKVNSRSGIYPSNTLQQAQIENMLAITPPGTPAYTRLAVKLAKINDQDISSADLGLQPQTSPQATPQETAQAASPIPTATEGLAVQPRGGTPTPSIA